MRATMTGTNLGWWIALRSGFTAVPLSGWPTDRKSQLKPSDTFMNRDETSDE